MSTVEVGLIGTGRMGAAMAGVIAEKGIRVAVYNRTRQRAEELAERIGAHVAATPAELAAGVDVLISMVADDEAVRAVYRADDGVLAGIGQRTVAVDMSTVLPDTIRDLQADVRATGAGLLDAPVSGSVTTASSGQLTIMVGGEAGDLERARPALEAVGSKIFHIGPLGAGAAMKLAVNAVIFGLNAAVAEGLVLAEGAGVDRGTAYQVLAESAVGAPFVQYKRAAFLDPDQTPTAFSLALAQKDLSLILALAKRTGTPMAQAAVNLDSLQQAAGAIGGERDFSSLASYLRSNRSQQ